MNPIWLAVFILAALAFAGGVAHLIGAELRKYRSRQAFNRVAEFQPRIPSVFGVDVDQQLSNRSERWD